MKEGVIGISIIITIISGMTILLWRLESLTRGMLWVAEALIFALLILLVVVIAFDKGNP